MNWQDRLGWTRMRWDEKQLVRSRRHILLHLFRWNAWKWMWGYFWEMREFHMKQWNKLAKPRKRFLPLLSPWWGHLDLTPRDDIARNHTSQPSQTIYSKSNLWRTFTMWQICSWTDSENHWSIINEALGTLVRPKGMARHSKCPRAIMRDVFPFCFPSLIWTRW